MIYVLPILIIFVIVYGLVKKVNIYDSFVKGGKDGLNLAISVFPYLVAIMILIELFNKSGLSSYLEDVLSPVLTMLGIPKELTSIIILRPLSGSGSIAMLTDIIEKYGVDSHIARSAQIIVGASETIFYVVTLYLSQCKAKKLRYAIPVALISSFVGVIVAVNIAKIM